MPRIGVSAGHLCSPIKLRAAFPRILFPAGRKLARFAKWSPNFGVRPSTQRCPSGTDCLQSPPIPCPACRPDCRPCQLSVVPRPPPHMPPQGSCCPELSPWSPFSSFPTVWGLPTAPGPESLRGPGIEQHRGNTAPPREAVGCRSQNSG